MPSYTLAGQGTLANHANMRLLPSTEQSATRIIACFGVLVFLLLLSPHSAAYLRLLFPVGACAVGAAVMRAHSPTYISYTLWLWILSPLVRRLVDYQSSFVDPSPILLAPVLVTLLTALPVACAINKGWRCQFLPFFLALCALIPALAIGLLSGNPKDVIQSCLLWVTPIIFGCYVAMLPMSGQSKFRLLEKQLTWALLIVGVYGVIQFLTAPAWETFWLENMMAQRDAFSFGRPAPLEIRVWSTLNGPGVAATFSMVCLLLLLVGNHRLRIPAMLAGAASLMLSLGRNAWVSLLAGVFVFFLLRTRNRAKMLLVCAFLAAASIPFAQRISSDNTIGERISTFGSLSQDESMRVRIESQQAALTYAIAHPLGIGLNTNLTFGEDPLDSGVVHTLLDFGWLGSALMFSAYGMIIWRLLSKNTEDESSGVVAARVCLVALFMNILGGDIGMGLNGILFWTMTALLRPVPDNAGTGIQVQVRCTPSQPDVVFLLSTTIPRDTALGIPSDQPSSAA